MQKNVIIAAQNFKKETALFGAVFLSEILHFQLFGGIIYKKDL